MWRLITRVWMTINVMGIVISVIVYAKGITIRL